VQHREQNAFSQFGPSATSESASREVGLSFTNSKGCPICCHNAAEPWLQGFDRFERRTHSYQLLRCPVCSLVWLADPPGPQALGEHYTSRYYQAIAAAGENSWARWQTYVRTVEKHKKLGTLLDVGCSSGGFLASLRNPNWNLYGIEISEALAEKARKLSGAQVFGGDVLEAPFESESFDVVTAFDVLEHLHQPKKTAERVWNWLKPGGIFYLVLPNIRSWEARTFHSYWFGLELPRHLYHFSPASLRRLLTFAGFKEESLTTPVCTYVEHSTNYVLDDVFAKLGVARAPLVDRKLPTFFWRIIRKGLRLTALSFVAEVASVCGAGPSIEAVFRKD
jgi:SAM-dependent methyltransferase